MLPRRLTTIDVCSSLGFCQFRRLDSIGGDRDSLEQRESRRNSAEGNSSGSGSGSGLSLPLRGTSVEPGINSPLSCSKGFAGEAEFNPFKKQDEKEVRTWDVLRAA